MIQLLGDFLVGSLFGPYMNLVRERNLAQKVTRCPIVSEDLCSARIEGCNSCNLAAG